MGAWQPAYVGVGSNLGDPAQQVRQAFGALSGLPQTRLVRLSGLYGSRALGPVQQPDFVNAVAGLLTQLTSLELLRHLRALEIAGGTSRSARALGPAGASIWICWSSVASSAQHRTDAAHPGVVERNFVLYPLADIAPDLDVPGLGRVAELAGRVASDGLRRR